MGDEELEIEIDATGKVTVRTKGIKGEACIDVVEALARLIGREESRALTPEFYEQAVVVASSKAQQKLAH